MIRPLILTNNSNLGSTARIPRGLVACWEPAGVTPACVVHAEELLPAMDEHRGMEGTWLVMTNCPSDRV